GECAATGGHLVARMGGDEFVILVERCTGPEQLVAVAEAALAAVAAPVHLGPHRLSMTASIGVVYQSAEDAQVADVIKAADVSLCHAKEQGRGRGALYEPRSAAEEIDGY